MRSSKHFHPINRERLSQNGLVLHECSEIDLQGHFSIQKNQVKSGCLHPGGQNPEITASGE
ncbi:MAG: hypothetical protein ABF649_20945 [Bacillus sp. (in: firmicutes)]